MDNPRIAILGGSGFVGRHLLARLREDDFRIRVIGRGDADAVPQLRMRDGAEWITGDVHDAAFLRAAFSGCDAVVNLAGILNEQGDDGSGFDRVFVELTEQVIAAMRETGVARLLQMSALHAGGGDSHYLQARGHAETRVRESRLDWTLFRPSVIAGPGDGLFCRFARLLRFTPMLPIGRAGALFQPVWIGDVCEAFARALRNPASIGQCYDLVGPERYTLADIVRMTAQAKGWTRGVIALPDALGQVQAEVGEHLPGKPISRDNWRSLQLDSTSDDNGLPKLGITPTPVPPLLPRILGEM
ncbi:NADH dehydrogenase [Luteimonas cucumeris]|uniref:NADH dehydrogenase n=1 Tax=Luteimonas cucumeris TaxID=985012 RepID=A0A562LE37_9GAMM|nr:complex I NDUFA9 subunit family protein [Luteimonas cucumeris]TWI05911.1 NADH dehydrogenase [Luteimonas cucumeris]